MSTTEQFLVMSLITAAITLVVALLLAATAIWLIEFLPVHMRLLRMRLKQIKSRLHKTAIIL